MIFWNKIKSMFTKVDKDGFKTIYKGKYIEYKVHVKTGYEKVGRTTTKYNNEDAVVIIGKNIDTGKYVCILEKRLPTEGHSGKDRVIAFPAGLVDDDGAEEAAKRELREETGYEIVRTRNITPVLYNSAGMTDESCKIVYCDVQKTGEQDLQDNEQIDVIELSTEQFFALTNTEMYAICAKVYQFFADLDFFTNEMSEDSAFHTVKDMKEKMDNKDK